MRAEGTGLPFSSTTVMRKESLPCPVSKGRAARRKSAERTTFRVDSMTDTARSAIVAQVVVRLRGRHRRSAGTAAGVSRCENAQRTPACAVLQMCAMNRAFLLLIIAWATLYVVVPAMAQTAPDPG